MFLPAITEATILLTAYEGSTGEYWLEIRAVRTVIRRFTAVREDYPNFIVSIVIISNTVKSLLAISQSEHSIKF